MVHSKVSSQHFKVDWKQKAGGTGDSNLTLKSYHLKLQVYTLFLYGLLKHPKTSTKL